MTLPAIQLPVTLDSANRRRDRSISLRFSTTVELPTDEFAEVDRLTPATGWLLFGPDQFEDADVPREDTPGDRKTQAQRIRALLFLIWKQNTDQSEDAEAYYRRRTEALIDLLKQELD